MTVRRFSLRRTFLLLLLILLHCLVHGDDSASNSTMVSKMDLLVDHLNLTNPILQEQFERFLSILNGEAPVYNETEYAERFAPSFIDAAPLAVVLVPIVDDLRNASNEWIVVEVVQEQPNGVVLMIAPDDDEGSDDQDARISLSMSVGSTDGRINGLLLSPASAAELENPPTTVEEAVAQIDALGHQLVYVVADILPTDTETAANNNDNVCEVVKGRNQGDPAPLGSMFKLWVLAALVDAINISNNSSAGSAIQWDQNVTITEEAKSLPSGIVQDDPVGNQRSVRELAELMISISDNTATDLLLHLVGRKAVEQVMVDTGHHDPSLNRPFLSTKEFFLLKLDGATGNGRTGPRGEQYLNEDTNDGRRAILKSLENVTVQTLDLDIVLAWAGKSTGIPIEVENIEWFASPMDLCKVLARLYRDAEARRILSLNPGIPDEQGLWSYIGFKGGSEPGVLGLAWYLVPSDVSAQHRVVTGSIWNPDSIVEETQASLLLGHLRDLFVNMSANETGSSPASGTRRPWSCARLFIAAILASSIQ